MLHVTGAFSSSAGSVAAGILNVRAWRAERPSEIALLLRLIRNRRCLRSASASAATLLFGHLAGARRRVLLGTFWVWAAIVLWAIAARSAARR